MSNHRPTALGKPILSICCLGVLGFVVTVANSRGAENAASSGPVERVEIPAPRDDVTCHYPSVAKLPDDRGVELAAGSRFGGAGPTPGSKTLVAHAELEPSEIQDLGDLMPQLLEIKNKSGSPLVFRVQIEYGDGVTEPNLESKAAINKLLGALKNGFMLQ